MGYVKFGWVLLFLLWQAPAWALGWVGQDFKGAPCEGEDTGYGPYDYTNPRHRKQNLKIVEIHHFTREVEALERGKSSHLVEDLDYTLRAFPNHHRALYSVIRYGRKQRRRHGELWSPPECYLQRAIAYRPKDAKARLLYGIYLHKHEKMDDAREQYGLAIKLSPNSAEAHYNLGLLLADMALYEEARAEAIKAYALGYPLPGLKQRLESEGYSLQ